MKVPFLRAFATSMVASSIIFAVNAQATSCKSLEQQACSTEPACTWVEGYQRSDGRSVRSYCRSAPTKRKEIDVSTSSAAKADG